MCSCGFDADVVRTLHLHRTGHVTSASYFNPIVSSIRHYDYPELRIYLEMKAARTSTSHGARCRIHMGNREGHEPKSAWRSLAVCAFNMPCYGGGLQIAPDADAADGLLDVCTFRHGGLLRGLYYTAAVLTGTHRWLNDFATRRSGSFRVTAEAKVPYQLDGDPGGFLPVDIAENQVPRRLDNWLFTKEKACSESVCLDRVCNRILQPSDLSPADAANPLLVIAGAVRDY